MKCVVYYVWMFLLTIGCSSHTIVKSHHVPKVSHAKKKVKVPKVIQRVAVLPIVNQSNSKVSPDIRSYLTDQIRLIMTHLPSYAFSIMTRENLTLMLDPEETTLEDCIGECDIETARLLNAHWLVTGSLMIIGSEYNLTLKVHHTQSAQFRKGITLKAVSIEVLAATINREVPFLLQAIDPKFPEGRMLLMSRSANHQTVNHQTTPLSLSSKLIQHKSIATSSQVKSKAKPFEMKHMIYFVNRQDKILRKSNHTLHQIFIILKQKPDLHIIIRGHTDQRERKTHHQKVILSKRRAEVIRRYLLLQGISANRLRIEALADQYPINTHSSLKNRIRSRRVDFTVQH